MTPNTIDLKVKNYRRISNLPSLGKIALVGTACISLLMIVMPLVFVFWLSFFQQEIPTFPPEGYSLRWFANISSQTAFVNGFMLSVKVTALATCIALLIGVPAAFAVVRKQLSLKAVFSTLLLLPMILPGIVIGAAIYVFQIEAEILTSIPIIGSFGGLVIAHVLVVIPWVVRLVGASLVGMDRSIEEASMNLGATPMTVFWRITLPSIRPGLVAGALLGAVISFGNLEMSMFLIAPGETTLPIAILQYLQWKIDPTVAAVSVIQILMIGVALLITDRFVKLSRVV